MNRISGATTFYKKTFPAVWFSALGIISVFAILKGEGQPFLVAVPIVMMVFGFLIFRMLVWDLVDEVYDCGDHLLFKDKGQSQRVYLRDVQNINHTSFTSPQRVTVMTRVEGSLGTELTFTPPLQWNPLVKPQIVSELIERVNEARGTTS